MKLQGRHTFAAGREVVWGVLYDPIVLENILPGGEAFEAVAPDEYRVTLHLRVGAIDDRFNGTLDVYKRQASGAPKASRPCSRYLRTM